MLSSEIVFWVGPYLDCPVTTLRYIPRYSVLYMVTIRLLL